MRLVIGAPAWDRAWSLPLWFQSVRANVNPAETGLVFVVPPTDTATRDAIAKLSEGFDWVEVLRDRGAQSTREERPTTQHETLAVCRNQILRVVTHSLPDFYLSWDTDFLVPPGTVEKLMKLKLPLVTVWSWLNRQAPRPLRYFTGTEFVDVLTQDSVCATAMDCTRGIPRHYPSHEFLMRSRGLWRTDVTLAWQLMDQRAYRVANYRPHSSGEDVPFSRQLAQRGVPRFCYGGIRGVHLYDRARRGEIELGWPGVVDLAEEVPLAAVRHESRPPEWVALGFYGANGHSGALGVETTA